LRKIVPRDFFEVGEERIEITRGNRSRREQDNRLPLPGTVLSRKWKGRIILVEVLAKGFRWENRHYSSLSAIAVAITGTRWNGLVVSSGHHIRSVTTDKQVVKLFWINQLQRK
jgi:hypothetical protein